jgi:hypothetical protein
MIFLGLWKSVTDIGAGSQTILNVEWWITVFNLLGSVGFMISALYRLAVPAG